MPFGWADFQSRSSYAPPPEEDRVGAVLDNLMKQALATGSANVESSDPNSLSNQLVSVTNKDMLAPGGIIEGGGIDDEITVTGQMPPEEMWDLGDVGSAGDTLPRDNPGDSRGDGVGGAGSFKDPAVSPDLFAQPNWEEFGFEPPPPEDAPEEEKKGWWKRFKEKLDANGDGKINFADIGAAFKNFLDANDDGKINWGDAWPLLKNAMKGGGLKALAMMFPPAAGLVGLIKIGLVIGKKFGGEDEEEIDVPEGTLEDGGIEGVDDETAAGLQNTFQNDPHFNNPWASPGDDPDTPADPTGGGSMGEGGVDPATGLPLDPGAGGGSGDRNPTGGGVGGPPDPSAALSDPSNPLSNQPGAGATTNTRTLFAIEDPDGAGFNLNPANAHEDFGNRTRGLDPNARPWEYGPFESSGFNYNESAIPSYVAKFLGVTPGEGNKEADELFFSGSPDFIKAIFNYVPPPPPEDQKDDNDNDVDGGD